MSNSICFTPLASFNPHKKPGTIVENLTCGNVIWINRATLNPKDTKFQGLEVKATQSNPGTKPNSIVCAKCDGNATSSYMASKKFSMLGFTRVKREFRKRNAFSISAQQEAEAQQLLTVQEVVEKEQEKAPKPQQTQPRPVETQINVKSKNMGKEYGGQWLSSATRHVRIYAAYIDPVTHAFDQTQMDKLTLLLDPTDEFLWTPETCHKVYSYFQELVDHYEGAPLTEYTLRLIGSDIEHYIRKLLYDGEIQYNMNARVLNFSMGKPRVGFNYTEGQTMDAKQ